MKFEKITVDSRMAEKWLALSLGNRALKAGHLARMVSDMTNGDWAENADPIVFDEHGALVDGHHRLTAIVRSGAVLAMWIARGLPRASVGKIDTGAVRSMEDRLFAYCDDDTIKSIVNGNTRRARTLGTLSGILCRAIARQDAPTYDDSLKMIRHYAPSMKAALENWGIDHRTRRAPAIAALTLAHAKVMADSNIDKRGRLALFIEGVKRGTMLEGGDPAHTLREYLGAHHTSRADKGAFARAFRFDSSWIIFMKSLRAMRAAITGETLFKIPILSDSTRLIEEFTGSREARCAKIGIKSGRGGAP